MCSSTGIILADMRAVFADDRPVKVELLLILSQAKRREQVSERIQAKIRTESTLHHEIAETEKELKSLRISTDSAEFVLKHKDAAVGTNHSSRCNPSGAGLE